MNNDDIIKEAEILEAESVEGKVRHLLNNGLKSGLNKAKHNLEKDKKLYLSDYERMADEDFEKSRNNETED